MTSKTHSIINYGKHHIDNNDVSAITKQLKYRALTQGKRVQDFEQDLKKYLGFKYCTVVSSGTSALYLMSKCLGWKKNDLIFTTPNTFVATANCIERTGAKTIFIDIDPITYCIDVTKLEEKIKKYKKEKKKIKAIIAVDFAGHPCDWPKLRSISKKYNLDLINDNCHALGAELNYSRKYASKYSDITTQSFHAVKNITTGEGGAIFSNNKTFDEKLKLFRSHGIIKKNFKSDFWYYEMSVLGENYRLSDIQCALGISQLKKINKFLKKRRKIAQIYDKAFSNDARFKIPTFNKRKILHAYHLYPLQIIFEKLKITKKNFFKKMLKTKIKLQVHYIPIFLHPYYKKKYKFNFKEFKNTLAFYKNEVSIPIFYDLNYQKQKKIINLIKQFCK